MSGRVIAAGLITALFCGLVTATAALEGTAPEARWSRPVAIATTAIEARPALVVDAEERAQVFFIDRDGARGVIRWITAGLDGRILTGPRALGEVDLRARALAAAADRLDVRLLWVAPSGEEMRVLSARIREDALEASGPLSPAVEDAGPVALAPWAGAHATWSQSSGGRRTIWYQGPGAAAAGLAEGDAPGISVGPGGPSIVWWQRVGFDTYRLVAAFVRAGRAMHALTGNLATSRLHPPAVAHDESGGVHIVFGTEQRAFGPSVGRLFKVDVGADGTISDRRPIAPGSPFAARAVAAPWRETAAFAWTDLRSGRSRNPEIYFGVPKANGLREERLTYSLAASAQPAMASSPGGVLAVAWLEVAAGGRYTLQFASTAHPAARHFLLGVPELDVYQPWEATPFAMTALVGTLPYAVFITLGTILLTAAAVTGGRAVLGATRWWSWLAASGRRTAVGALGVALACQIVVTTVLPLVPRLPLPAAVTVLVLVWAWLGLRRSWTATVWQHAALVLLVVFGITVALAFASVARTLSQLAT